MVQKGWVYTVLNSSFMDRDQLPSEEEQFIAYKEVVEAMEGRLVVFTYHGYRR